MDLELGLPMGLQGNPGQHVIVPIILSDAAEVISATLDVTYDPAVLEIANTPGQVGCKDVTLGPVWSPFDHWYLVANAVKPGWLRIVAYSPLPVQGQEAEIVRMKFKVREDASLGTTEVLVRPVSDSEGGHGWIAGVQDIEIVGAQAPEADLSQRHNHIVLDLPEANWEREEDNVIRQVHMLFTNDEIHEAIARAREAGQHLPVDSFLHIWAL